MPRDSLKYNMRLIDDERAASILGDDCYRGPLQFDSKLAEKDLRKEGYGPFIDTLRQLRSQRK